MLDCWSRVEIDGRAVDVFDPPGARPFALVYLHSLRLETPATDAAFTAALAKLRLRCLAPHGGACWWADRPCPGFDGTTPERYLLNDLMPWAEARWSLGPRAVALAGREMGGQGAVRIALKHPERVPVAASLSGAFDCQEWYGRGTPLDEMYESRERCRLDTAILHVGATWPRHIWFRCPPTDAMAYRGNDRLHEKLSAMGVPHTCDLDAPESSATTAEMLAFVSAALEQESRRLM